MRCTMWTLKSFLSAALICMWTIFENLNVSGTASTTASSSRKDISYPNPLMQHNVCRRRRPSFVCDPDGILSSEQADGLDSLLKIMQNTTPCLCPVCSNEKKPSGISFGIFLKENFTYEERSTVGFNSKELAKKLREEWKLGKCEDDIIIVVIAEEKKSGVSLGSTVMSVLPYQAAEQIAKECDGHFTANYSYYGQGLSAIVYSFHDILQQSPRRDTKPVRRKNIGIIIGISLGVIVIIILTVSSGIILVRRQLKKKKKSKGQNSTVSWKKQRDTEPYEYRLCKKEDPSSTYKSEGDSSDSDEENQPDNCDFGLEIDIPKQGTYLKRELSDVPEETEDTLPANVESNAGALNFPLNKSRSLEVTEL